MVEQNYGELFRPSHPITKREKGSASVVSLSLLFPRAVSSSFLLSNKEKFQTHHHSHQLPRHRHHHQGQASKPFQRFKDEELTERAGEGVEEERFEEGWVEGEEGEEVGEGGVRGGRGGEDWDAVETEWRRVGKGGWGKGKVRVEFGGRKRERERGRGKN